MNQYSALAATTLKLVGALLMVTTILEYIVLAYPPDVTNLQWRLGYISQIVNRGIIPLVGLALLFTGFGIDSNASPTKTTRNALLDVRFWGVLLSGVLGAGFLVMSLVHLNDVRMEQSNAMSKIAEEAQQAENQLVGELSSDRGQAAIKQQQDQIKSQISSLLEDPQRVNQVLNDEKVPPDMKKLVEQSKDKPKELEKLVQEQYNFKVLSDRGLNEIRTRKKELEKQTNDKAWKIGLQNGIQSLILGLGYITIGVICFQSLGYLRGGRRKTPAR